MNTVLVGAISIALMFLLLIAPHEGGHFAVAKLFGTRVIEFSIGIGPRLWSRARHSTLYAIRLLPVGGYVRLGGMEPGEFDEPNGFHAKPAYQRLLVLAAGPIANFLVAALIVCGILLTQLNDDPGKIQAVDPGTPAAAAGLRAGDSILRVGKTPIQRPDDIRQTEAAHPGEALQFAIRRADGRQETLTIQPRFDDKARAWVIGIHPIPVVRVSDAVRIGAMFPVQAGTTMSMGIYHLISGQIPGGIVGPAGATGAIGIGFLTYQAAVEGPEYWLTIAAYLSVALGLANLLPLPALDGGRILVVLLEKLRGKPFDRQREMAVQRAGLIALLALVAFIAYFDVQRIANHQFPGLK